jgi:hypothetical protein
LWIDHAGMTVSCQSVPGRCDLHEGSAARGLVFSSHTGRLRPPIWPGRRPRRSARPAELALGIEREACRDAGDIDTVFLTGGSSGTGLTIGYGDTGLSRKANASLSLGTKSAGKGFARARDRAAFCPRDPPSPAAETGSAAPACGNVAESSFNTPLPWSQGPRGMGTDKNTDAQPPFPNVKHGLGSMRGDAGARARPHAGRAHFGERAA